jgi:short-subunit dehydrogenase
MTSALSIPTWRTILCRYVRGMRSRNRGRIVFVSSEPALRITSEMIHYGITKTSQSAVSRGLAETLAGTGVTVNSVLPGPTASEGSTDSPNKRPRPRWNGNFSDRTSILLAAAIRHA